MYKRLTKVERSIIMSVLHSRWDREKIRELLKKEDLKIHFIGVGGIGMCSLALLSQR